MTIATGSGESDELAAGLLAQWPAVHTDAAVWAYRIVDVLGYRRSRSAGDPPRFASTHAERLTTQLPAIWPDMSLVAPALGELVVDTFGYRQHPMASPAPGAGSHRRARRRQGGVT
ncbi:hypothetical protein G4X40_11740 [Rhodococcus sp. D2-41]|uniref:Uncharacterized protein n=1 Tax=Speluncibacter jeojiensis TaxID=2710754 RepID=A0A9X4RD62_9ACTN|nr:hypothetical protein [Rhodococcus sp. D2-41]MDG3010820.1 hypothetical protein [Rhodococcus sp. D2-41]MDG3013792.1 hypothetical protein [Corynebacteriales bacterium D3-21]